MVSLRDTIFEKYEVQLFPFNYAKLYTIRYKYSRIAQLMQVLLCEQRTLNSGMMAMTQVG